VNGPVGTLGLSPRDCIEVVYGLREIDRKIGRREEGVFA